MEIIYFLTVLFNAYLINCIKWGKEYIVYSEVLLVSILQYYNFSVEIMNELDISNYLTPRYLAELIDDNGYYINLRIYSERYDWDLAMALETIYVEIGLRQCGRSSPFVRESFKGNLVGNAPSPPTIYYYPIRFTENLENGHQILDVVQIDIAIYVEIGLRQCGRSSPFVRESFKGNLVQNMRKFYRSADWKSSCIIISSWKSYIF